MVDDPLGNELPTGSDVFARLSLFILSDSKIWAITGADATTAREVNGIGATTLLFDRTSRIGTPDFEDETAGMLGLAGMT
jgi:hypothetical protein